MCSCNIWARGWRDDERTNPPKVTWLDARQAQGARLKERYVPTGTRYLMFSSQLELQVLERLGIHLRGREKAKTFQNLKEVLLTFSFLRDILLGLWDQRIGRNGHHQAGQPSWVQ